MYSSIKIEKEIKLVVCDFDGIFTDGGVYIGENDKNEPVFFKKISYKDIMAIHLLLKSGVKFGIISGETSSACSYLKQKFPDIILHQSIRNKLEVLIQMSEEMQVSHENILFMGDDVNDMECLKFAGTKISVPNANSKIKTIEGIQITNHFGSDGALREVADKIIEKLCVKY